MKIKSFFVAALLACTGALTAQLPNPLKFNTAINTSYTGLVGINNAGSNWEVALTNIGGPYYFAKQDFITGWVVSPDPLSSWVTYPLHGCSGAINLCEHQCKTSPLTGVQGDVEEFYRIKFNLPATVCQTPVSVKGAYNLAIKFFADNLVYQVYINNTLFWTNPVVLSSYNANDNHSALSKGIPLNLNNFWQAGPNEIIIQVRSGAPNPRGWTGFMAVVDQVNTTREPCDPPTGGGGNPSGCCLGNSCGNTQNPLATNYEVPLNNFDFNFTGNGTDKVNVGYNCSTEGIGKLNSLTSVQTNQTAGASPESVSIFGDNKFSNRGAGVGVMGIAKNTMSDGTTGNSFGVWGDATGAGNNTGGRFFAGDTKALRANRYNIGVSGVALPSNGMAPAYSYMASYPGANIGVYGAGVPNNSEEGGTGGPDWAAWFDGDVNIVGNCFWNGGFQFSDKRFKKDIKPLESVNEKIQKLSGYTYSFRTDEFKAKGFDTRSHIGLIAQEIKEVFPELVITDAKGFYAVDYQGMIPVLLVAAKEQGKTIADQNAQIAQQAEAIKQQQQQVDELKALIQSMAGVTNKNQNSGTSVVLSDKNAVVLNQNTPNPFAESTVISYNIPSDFTKAQIIFTTNEGKVIKTVEITVKGSGSLSVFANDLTHGVYSYSLVIDGKTVDTKKMIKD